MKGWLTCLKGRHETMLPLIIAVTLTCLLILCGIMEFFRLSLIASGVKGALQDTVVVVIDDNYTNVYHGVRKRYSGGYYTEGYGFEERVDIRDIYYHLDETPGTRWERGSRVKYAGDVLEYKITELGVTIHNAPLASSGPVDVRQFEADAVVWLEVPVRFAGKTLPIMEMKLKVQAGYIEIS